jgi:hypothetical protein
MSVESPGNEPRITSCPVVLLLSLWASSYLLCFAPTLAAASTRVSVCSKTED